MAALNLRATCAGWSMPTAGAGRATTSRRGVRIPIFARGLSPNSPSAKEAKMEKLLAGAKLPPGLEQVIADKGVRYVD